jgi:protein TIF31
MAEPRNGEDSAVAKEEETKADDLNANANVDFSQQVFKNLVILPPLQKKDRNSEGRSSANGTNQELYDAVPLPPIRAEEPVSSIRAALGEIRGYAHLTNYRFVLENNRPGDNENDTSGKKISASSSPANGSGLVASQYTGLNAIISTKEVVKSFLDKAELTNATDQNIEGAKEDIVLDEFGDLTSLLGDDKAEGLKDGSKFRVVLERYDIALIRDHIARLRTLLDGNAPTSVTLDESSGDVADSESTSQPTAATETESDSSTDADGKSPQAEESSNEKNEDTPTNKEEEQQKASNPKQKKDTPNLSAKDMPVFSTEKSLSPDINDLKNFFYYACGEDPSLYLDDSDGNKKDTGGGSKSKKKGKKRNSKAALTEGENTNPEAESKEQLLKRIIPQLNEIEERTRVSCDIRFSGFHPPPQYRQFMGDLAYMEVTLPDGELVSVSATPIGFYVNRSSLTRGDYKFNPSPAEKPCFSHELLDCLILYSKSFSDAWNDALIAAKSRADLMLKINEDGPFQSFFRVAIRGDFPGYKKPSVASASEGIDALVQIPSWLVPIPQVELEANNSWNRNCEHAYSSTKTEGDLSNSFGVDIRNGSLRDWNEELQVAREMPMDNLLERIERARYVDDSNWIFFYETPLFLCVPDVRLLISSVV